MSNARFTAWLSTDEREGLRKLAQRNECSENFIVRMAVRSLLYGVPIPKYLQDQLQGTVKE